jgi:hypothetical protein
MKDRALTPDLVFPTNSANPLGTPILHLFVAMVYPALHHTSEPVPTRRRVSNCKKLGTIEMRVIVLTWSPMYPLLPSTSRVCLGNTSLGRHRENQI